MDTQFFYSDLTTSSKTPPSPTEVRATFLDLLRYASKGGIEEKGDTYIQEIALLMDQLIDLVAAAEALRQEGGAVSGSESRSISSSSFTGQEGEAHE